MISPTKHVIQRCAELGIKPANQLLAVHLRTQTMQFYRGGELVRAFVISSSLRPPAHTKGSLGTPLGLHNVAEKIGHGQPPGTVFRSRTPTGRHYQELGEAENRDNLITTRILWLHGLEPGVNQGGDVDSHDRYIYIHGTNHEERLGTPQSAGCILMRNVEIAELFEEIRTGDLVWIAE
ncbi:MAG TPA: L,D-transpeptidase [Opitutaceae bacterium]|nr:L,D-transpeptidase [Opitutaceae bacterium]